MMVLLMLIKLLNRRLETDYIPVLNENESA
jgi:hypothetical protein